MRKKRKLKLIPFLTAIVILLAIVLLVLIVLYTMFKKEDNEESLLGSWTTDNVTIYQFNDDDTGVLKLPLSEYQFTYQVKDNKLMIDFENEKSEDSTYTYLFKDGKLVLKNINGTFTFKKKK